MSAMRLKSINLTIMWFAISTVLLINGFETYDETDQLAEESVGGEHEGPEEAMFLKSSQKSNDSLDETIPKKSSGKESSVEDEPNDPLQKILPKIQFNCKGKSEGYYADNEFCEVFHYCKTNGFRFTFMCPPESYYNHKLMACEYNSTVSLCKQRDKQMDNKQNQDFKITSDNVIKASAGQKVEVFQPMNSDSIVKNDTTTTAPVLESTTTLNSTTVIADPYLTKWRAMYRSKNKPKDPENSLKMTQNNTKPINKPKPTDTQTILPFRGFGRNRNKTQQNNPIIKEWTESNVNAIKANDNNESLLNNSTPNPLLIPSNAWPVINSLKKHYQNPDQITTTSPPSLLRPTTRGPITVSPFDYFSHIFDTENRFKPKPEFPSNPSITSHDNTNRRPVLTQNFFNTIFHSTNNKSFENDSQKQTFNEDINSKEIQTNYEENVNQMKKMANQDLIEPDLLGYDLVNRAPVYNNIFDNIQQKPQESQESRDLFIDDRNQSEIKNLKSMKIIDLIQRLKQMENSNQDLKQMDSNESAFIDPSDGSNDRNGEFERRVKERKRNKKEKQLVTVPLLVPTGISKTDLKRRLSTTLLKPTFIPLTESGQQIPAYVLEFGNSRSTHKSRQRRNRFKRQIFNWNNPFLRNQYLGQTYYLPMNSMTSSLYSNFDNFKSFRNGLPMGLYNERHLGIGEKPGYRISPSAQQHFPYYLPQKQPFMANNIFGNNFDNTYDLSEFSDFYPNSLNKKSNAFLANDFTPYRSVSLRRPSFRRPPLRNRIPDLKRNETKKTDVTTASPVMTIPVSPRPYSRPLPQRYPHPVNSNPFTDISDENYANIGEAIKLFDGNEDNFRPLFPTEFDSQPIFSYNSPQSYSNDFKPFTPNSRTISSALNGRSSQSSINTLDSNIYPSDDFPPLPHFGDPSYRLPFVDMPDPGLRNIGFRATNLDNNNKNDNQKHVNSSRHSTPYSPELGFAFNTNNQKTNESERNPNHNYDVIDKESLQTTRSEDYRRNLVPVFNALNWDNIVGHYSRHNTSNTSSAKENTTDSQTPTPQKYISYGTRLSGANHQSPQNNTFSVRTSIREVSSLQSEASNQIVIRKKLDTSLSSEKKVGDNNDTNVDELYNQRLSDRLLLFNYYNRLNSHKPKPPTTTMSPILRLKYPSTTHWSIRGWTGYNYPYSSRPSTTTTTIAPMTTTNKHFEIIDLFESESKPIQTVTELYETTTTETPDPPYKRVFSSYMGATLQTTTNSKPHNFSHKTRSEISNYLNSLTSTQKSILN